MNNRPRDVVLSTAWLRQCCSALFAGVSRSASAGASAGALAIAAGLLAACGASSGPTASGIGGTGFVARGEISAISGGATQAVDSITVNGSAYALAGASVSVDDSAASADDLRLGMVVTVRGSGDLAEEVVYDDEVEGPIVNLQIAADGDSATFDVFGIAVSASASGTHFDADSSGFGLAALADKQMVEVSGFRDNGALQATRIELKSASFSAGAEVEVKGTVSGLGASSFTLAGNPGLTISFDAGTELDELPGGTLSDGDFVEVRGTLNATMDQLDADEIEGEDGALGGEDGAQSSVEGLVGGVQQNTGGNPELSAFTVAGQLVDASGAGTEFRPASLAQSLADGMRVEVEGELQGGVLVADEVKLKSEARVAALLDEIDESAGTLTLTFAPGLSIVVDYGAATEFDEPLSLLTVDISHVEVEGAVDAASGRLQAARVRDAEQNGSEPVSIRARVEAFTAPGIGGLGSGSITLLGVDFTAGGAVFEAENGDPIDSTTFWSQLRVGDEIELEDELAGNLQGDGSADKVAFED